MPKIAYDVTGVESGQDFDTPVPVGIYKAKISEAEQTTAKSSGNPMLAITLEITSGEWKGRNLWDYIVLNESSAWKLRQLLEAVGIISKNGKSKTKGEFDPRKIVGTAVMVKVKHETDTEYGTRARPGSILPVPDDAEEEAEADEAEASSDEEYTWDDLQEYDRDDLEALIEEEELEVKFNSKTKDDVLLERVAEALGIEEEEDEEDEPDDDGEEEDYSEWAVSDLKAELKERNLPSSGPKSKLVKRLEEDDANDDDDGEPF